MSVLSIQKLSHRYKTKVALTEIELRFDEPALVGIFGHNGCGKSTLLKLLSGLLPCQSGELHIFGEQAFDAQRHIKSSIRSSIGTLFQETSSDAMLTLGDNIRYFSHMMGLYDPSLIDQTLKLANLFDEREQRVKTLSHGMRRRLELYRTFMHKPKLVLLDEPSAGLDAKESARFLSFIKEYQKKESALILCATHDPQELEHCDQVVMMQAGTILLQEKPEKLTQELDHWRYEVELDPKGEVRAFSFMRADLSEVYNMRQKSSDSEDSYAS